MLEAFEKAQIIPHRYFGSWITQAATRVAKLPPALWLTVPLEAIARAVQGDAPRRCPILRGKPWARR